MAFWNRKRQTQVSKRPGIAPDAPPRKANWVQRREETKEEERLQAESVKTGIEMGPIKPSGELTHQQKGEKEALDQVGHMRQEAEGKAPTVEEAALNQLLREASAVQAETEEGTAPQAPEGQQAPTTESPEGTKPTLTERRAAALDRTKLEGSIAKFKKEVKAPAGQKAPEGKVAVPVGSGDSEAKG